MMFRIPSGFPWRSGRPVTSRRALPPRCCRRNDAVGAVGHSRSCSTHASLYLTQNSKLEQGLIKLPLLRCQRILNVSMFHFHHRGLMSADPADCAKCYGSLSPKRSTPRTWVYISFIGWNHGERDPGKDVRNPPRGSTGSTSALPTARNMN